MLAATQRNSPIQNGVLFRVPLCLLAPRFMKSTVYFNRQHIPC